MMETDKILQSRCQQLLKEYEDLLIMIIDEEKKTIDKREKIKDTEFETVKEVIQVESLKEGMDTLLKRINHYAATQE